MNSQSGKQSSKQATSSQEMLNGIVPNSHLTLPMAVVNFLTPQECENVIALTKDLQINDAEVHTEQSSIQYSKRKSNICWLPPNEESNWLYLKVQELTSSCNANYLYDIRGFFEGMQVATYKDGGHFDWHMDVGADKLSLRKLSVTIQLSNPGDYEGGELEFMGQELVAPKECGTAIVFPAFLYHRVKPVTRGSRTSVVTWVHGPPFK